MIIEQLGKHGLNDARGRRGPGDHREAVRDDAGRGQGPQPARAVGLRGEAALPHRPLLGQGDRSERHGVPVRQRAVRARVEPQLHRPRRDHRGRGPDDRDARGLLRQRGRAARPGAEPHAPAAVQRGDGAAGALRRRRDPRREGQGPAVGPEADGGRRSTRSRSARSTAPGTIGGVDVKGYLQEDGVPSDSNTETYAALRLEIDNWRWAGVPFYLRTGKSLARKVTEIAITLKPVPHLAFQQEGSVGVRPNQLILTMQPNEGVSLSLGAKIPGTRMRIRPVNMEFLYGTSFMSQSPEAYERLILDAMRGDATLFTRNDEVEAQWEICDPIVSQVGGDAGAAAAVRGRARRVRRRPSGCSRPARAGGRSRRWRRSTPSGGRGTPTRVRSTRRCASALSQVHRENAGYVPARVLNLVTIVDKQYSGEIANRLRQGRAATTRRARSCARSTRGARRSTPSRRSRRRAEVRDGQHRAAARDGRRRVRHAAPEAPRPDRGSAGRDRPADLRLGAARARRGGRLVVGHVADRADRRRRRARARRRAAPRPAAVEEGLRGRPRVAALDAVARAHRRNVRPADGPARAEDDLGDHDPPPPRLAPSPRCCSSAGWRRGWAGPARR